MILVGGENLMDLVSSPEGDGATFRAVPGGAPFNWALALGRLGVEVGYLTPLSTDAFGAGLTARLAGAGVRLLAPPVPAPTSLAVATVTDGVAAYSFYRENTAERQVTAELLADITPARAEGVVLGSLAIVEGRDADIWADYYCAMQARGVFCALDPNIRPGFIRDETAYRGRLDRLLRHSDLVKLSDEDLAWLFPDLPLEEAARALAGQSRAGLVVVTRGAEGALALCGDMVVETAAQPVADLVDTIGAGDTFMAVLVAGLAGRAGGCAGLQRPEIFALLARAGLAAALNCVHAGCRPPTRTELARAMEIHGGGIGAAGG